MTHQSPKYHPKEIGAWNKANRQLVHGALNHDTDTKWLYVCSGPNMGASISDAEDTIDSYKYITPKIKNRHAPPRVTGLHMREKYKADGN